MNIDMKILAENVRRLRIENGLEQRELAELAGVSRMTIGNIERVTYDRANPSTLKAIAKAFDTTVEALASAEPERKLIKATPEVNGFDAAVETAGPLPADPISPAPWRVPVQKVEPAPFVERREAPRFRADEERQRAMVAEIDAMPGEIREACEVLKEILIFGLDTQSMRRARAFVRKHEPRG